MDRTDKEILRLLQRDATLSVNDIAEQVGLSTTPCWRRIQLLEKNGVISKRVALLNADKLNLGMTVFVQIKVLRRAVYNSSSKTTKRTYILIIKRLKNG